MMHSIHRISFAVFLLISLFIYYWESVVYKKLNYEVRENIIIQKGGTLFSDYETELNVKNITHIKLMVPFIEKMREKYKLGKIILTADKGLNSGNNLLYLHDKNDGYIVSQKVRGASKSFINKILEEEGYKYNKGNTFKVKSFFREREVKKESGEKMSLSKKNEY